MRELMQLNFPVTANLHRRSNWPINALIVQALTRSQVSVITTRKNMQKTEKRTVDGHGNDPKDAEACYNLARTYLDMEEYKKALPYYTGSHS